MQTLKCRPGADVTVQHQPPQVERKVGAMFRENPLARRRPVSGARQPSSPPPGVWQRHGQGENCEAPAGAGEDTSRGPSRRTRTWCRGKAIPSLHDRCYCPHKCCRNPVVLFFSKFLTWPDFTVSIIARPCSSCGARCCGCERRRRDQLPAGRCGRQGGWRRGHRGEVEEGAEPLCGC